MRKNAAAARVEDRAEEARRVEVRKAEPVDRAVEGDQGHRVQVADDAVVLDRRVAHATAPPPAGSPRRGGSRPACASGPRAKEGVEPAVDVVLADGRGAGGASASAARLRAWLRAVRRASAMPSTSYGLTSSAPALQLGRGPRELREDEDAVAVDARRAVLLADEVHPVLERRDERDVGGAVVRGQAERPRGCGARSGWAPIPRA